MTATLHPGAPVAAPLELLRDHARLPGAERVLDPAHLSTLLGAEVTPDRVRIKPGASVLIGHRRVRDAEEMPGRAVGDVGWTLLVASDDKRRNLLDRAARHGVALCEHPADAGGPFLLSGGIDGDPRLGGEIERVLRRQKSGTAPRVLSFNPGRHAVLLLPGTGEVLRVAARPLDGLLQVSDHWRELGLPTVAQHRWRDRAAVLVGERWGHGDLAALAAHPLSMPAAARLGEVIARLHAADVSGLTLPGARIGSTVPETTAAFADLLPHRAERIAQLSARLRAVLPGDDAQVLIHGDLSPDQVLVRLDRSAAAEGSLPLRVVDLDRSGLGPAGADLGSWLASCLLAGVEEQADAFLDGYARRRALPGPDQLAAWTARALLAAALDPMRRYGEDWLPAVERRLALAEAVLERPERLPLPAGSRPAPDAAAGTGPAALVPARVEHHGRVLTVRRAWADDGRGLPLELVDEAAGGYGDALRGARLDAATGQVTVLGAGTDPRLPGLARMRAAHPGAVIVSHRPGKRAVLRLTGEDGTARFVKIVRPGRADRLLAAIARAEDFTGPFRTARVLAADDDTVTFAELPGHLLHEGLPVEDGTWRRAWRDTLDAWTAAVRTSRARLTAAEVHGTEVHGPQAEAAVLTAWRDRAAAVDPDGSRIRARAAAAAQRELARLDGVDRPALIHRDLHDKQILWQAGQRPALLDVDTAAVGDPALDAGNLRAHATWRALQGLWTEAQAEVVREEIDRAALRSGIRPETLAAYESATIARLACVYAFRPQWRAAARALAATLGPTPDSRPAPAGEPTPPGGTATPCERSISR